MQCNCERQTCDGYNLAINWSAKIPAKQIYNEEKNKDKVVESVLCEDKITRCDPLKTCCKFSDGNYGCCPYTGKRNFNY
jgi:hypothetical protein